MASKETKEMMQEVFDMLHINATVNTVKECLDEASEILAGRQEDDNIHRDNDSGVGTL